MLDRFINRALYLKWIPYNEFENVEYFDKGGFSTIYTATWLGYYTLVLKSLNPNEDLNELLNEVQYNIYLFIF